MTPLAQASPQVRIGAADRRQSLHNVLCCLLICLVCGCFFSKTIFGGKPISKLHVLSHMDSLYYPENKSIQVVAAIDPSIYFFRLPTSISVEKSWKQGVVPLWNPNNACGHPMLGMIESGAFNWYIMLFPFSSEYAYNLGIVARDLIACLGTFWLARCLGLSPGYATFAGLLLGFCPYFLRELELSKETYIYSAMFALFIQAARKRTIGWSSFLSIACGLVCATMHPECSLNLVFFASFYVVLEQFFANLAKGLTTALGAVGATIGWLAVFVGIPAFFIAAPVLLPFLEFVRNSDCYKFDYGAPPRVLIQAFLLTLTHPTCYGLSPFLGILAVPLMLSKLTALRRGDLAFCSCIILSVALTTLVGPLLEVFEHKPWNLLEPIYLQPLVMVFLAVLTAMGLEVLCQKRLGQRYFFFVISALVVVAVPWLVDRAHLSFSGWIWDGGEWRYQIVKGALRQDLILVLLAAASTLLCWRFRAKTWLALSLVVLIFISEWSVSRQALPTNEGFMPVETPIIKWLKAHPGRVLTLGNHLMLPNINMCWDISSLRHNNGLFPPRFLEFEKLCGGNKGASNGYSFDNALTGILDTASIRYLLSDSAVSDVGTENYFSTLKCSPLASFDDFSVDSSELQFDSGSRQAFAALRMRCAKPADYILQFAVYDSHSDERPLWQSAEYRLGQENKKPDQGADNEVFVLGRWNVPTSVSRTENLRYAFRLNSIWNGAPTFPSKVRYGQIRNNVVAAQGCLENFADFRVNCSIPFQLRAEFDGQRVYENTATLPEAFCVGGSRPASSIDEARSILLSKSFDPRREVLVEGESTPLSGSGKMQRIELIRVNGNKLRAEAVVVEPSYLVITDTFYPGWKAFVNGSEKAIVRGNYLFRAIRLEPGVNHVEIVYEPQSFFWGLIMCGCGFMVLLVLNIFELLRRRVLQGYRLIQFRS